MKDFVVFLVMCNYYAYCGGDYHEDIDSIESEWGSQEEADKSCKHHQQHPDENCSYSVLRIHRSFPACSWCTFAKTNRVCSHCKGRRLLWHQAFMSGYRRR